MRSRFGRFRAFAEGELSAYLDDRKRRLQDEVHSAEENYILNVADEQYAEYLVSKYTVEPLEVNFDEVSVSTSEEPIPAEWFPSGFNVYAGKKYPKPVFTYHLPFRGEESLLRLTPGTRLMWTTDVYVDGNELCFDVVAFREDDPEPVKRDADGVIQKLRSQAQHVTTQIRAFNHGLPRMALEVVRARKDQLLRRRNLAASLGVPIRRKEDLAETYAVPTPAIVRKVAPRPEVREVGFTPHPTLDADTYSHILRTLHDLGRVFERQPSLYVDRGEEDLRDQILLYLTPRYEASTTSETFNKAGKTDILMRHENSNLFVAECLIWKGPKYYLEKIDQLLGYLTWRDSKAAVIIFVRNKDVSSVLATVEEVTPSHTQYLRLVERPDEAWFNYRFHLPADRNLEVRTAVMLFHVSPA